MNDSWIGVFAHNEASGIEAFLAELRGQSLFSGKTPVHLRVLENGSTDDTAQRARAALEKHYPGVDAGVVELPVGDKGGAWNEFVHRISPGDAGFLLMVDADIQMDDGQTLEKVIRRLGHAPEAWVAVDCPHKDIERTAGAGVRGKLSLAGSAAGGGGTVQLCGQLYAGRAEILRRFVLPLGLLVEDGLLRALILTDGFQEEEKEERLVRANDARHYFEAVTRPAELFRHERRLAVGTELNIMLFFVFKKMAAEGQGISDWIIRQNAADQNWVRTMALEAMAAGTFTFHTASYTFKPLRGWRWDVAHLKRLPLIAVRIVFNGMAALSAKRALKRGKWAW